MPQWLQHLVLTVQVPEHWGLGFRYPKAILFGHLDPYGWFYYTSERPDYSDPFCSPLFMETSVLDGAKLSGKP